MFQNFKTNFHLRQRQKSRIGAIISEVAFKITTSGLALPLLPGFPWRCPLLRLLSTPHASVKREQARGCHHYQPAICGERERLHILSFVIESDVAS